VLVRCAQSLDEAQAAHELQSRGEEQAGHAPLSLDELQSA